MGNTLCNCDPYYDENNDDEATDNELQQQCNLSSMNAYVQSPINQKTKPLFSSITSNDSRPIQTNQVNPSIPINQTIQPPQSSTYANSLSLKSIQSQEELGKYKGFLLGAKREGFGLKNWVKSNSLGANKQKGIFHYNQANGYGFVNKGNGDVYKGEYHHDKANGFGVYQYISGGVYIGEWANDAQNGIGYEKWADGSNYSGTYHQGMKHGYGKYIWHDHSMYYGEWYQNNIHGYGYYVFTDGRKYHGHWDNNFMHGYGELSYENGSNWYIGIFNKNKRNGFGIMLNTIKQVGYIGFWSTGNKNGYGKLIYPNGACSYYKFNNNKKEEIYNDEKNFYQAIKEDHLLKYLTFFKMDYDYVDGYITNIINIA